MSMRVLYTILLYGLSPLILVRLIYRGFGNRAYWQRWPERFGYFRAPRLARPVWIHAVSVGEVQAAVPLIHTLLERHPEHSIVVTTMTPTGSRRVEEIFGPQVFHVYLPYDFPGAMGRFLDKLRPELALIMETELWPNLFQQCAKRKIPVGIANARLSPGSLQGYQRVARLVRETLNTVAFIAAQTQSDADRFIALGADARKVIAMGNLKYDQRLPEDVSTQASGLREQWGRSRPVWIAASTHEGEEEAMLNVHAQLCEHWPDTLLIIAPRHPERFDKLCALATARGFSIARRTRTNDNLSQANLFVLDTLGELVTFYAAADVAFIGGSLVPVGGHNMLEAAGVSVPVVFGPQLFNFTEISNALLDVGAAKSVEDASQLVGVLLEILGDADQQRRMGEAGRQLVEDNRGALARLLEKISPWLA